MSIRLTGVVLATLWFSGHVLLPRPSVLDELVRLADQDGRVLVGRIANTAHVPSRAPARGPSGPATGSFALLQAAARVQRAAAADPAAQNLHQLGVGLLLLGDRERAVQLIEDAVLQAPTADGQNDLAVAYLELAADDRPELLPAAVEAADRAIQLAPSLAAPYYNLAVAFEKLHLEREALAAWEEYLRLETIEGWSREASEKADAVRRSVALAEGRMGTAIRFAANPVGADSLSDALSRETDADVGDALLLDWFDRRMLLQWSEDVLGGRADRAAASVAALDSLLSADRRKGASAELTRFIAECLTPPAPLVPVARALRDYYQGMAALDVNNTAAATAQFGRVSRGAAVSCRPLHFRAEVQLAIADNSGGAVEESGRRLSAIAAVAADVVGPRLLAAAHRAHAMTDLVHNDNSSAIRHLEAALVSARQSGDMVVEGRILNNLADALDVEGRRRESWHARLAALEIVARFPAGGLPTSVYGSAGLAVSRGRHVRLGLALANTEQAAAAGAGGLISRFLLESRKADLHVARRDEPALRDTIRAADALLASLRGDPRAVTLGTLLAPARAFLVDLQPAEALRVVDEAIGVLGERVPSRVARLRLLRSRLLASSGETGRAIQELQLVANLLRRLGRGSLSDTIEASTTQEFGAVGRLLVRMLLDRGAPDDALAIWMTVRAAIDGETPEAVPAIPAGLALVQYAVLDDRVVAWLQAPGVATHVTTAELAPVQFAKSRLDTAVLQGGDREALNEAFAAFYDLLIRPLQLARLRLDRIVVIPDAMLAALPFGSFRDRTGRTHLFEQLIVEMAWRVPASFDAGRPSVGRRALVVADPGTPSARGAPALPSAVGEAATIAAMYADAVVLLGADATEARVLAGLLAADIVHWAGHAVVNDADGRYSYLAVAGERASGQLTAGRIASLRMPAGSLVILAACRSINSPYRAFHARSLGSAFQKAGARDVVGVAWDIPDNEARPFFEALHRELAKGERPVVALRTVQRRFLSQSPREAGVALAAAAYVS